LERRKKPWRHKLNPPGHQMWREISRSNQQNRRHRPSITIMFYPNQRFKFKMVKTRTHTHTYIYNAYAIYIYAIIHMYV
jgi:hypothetical protein